MKSIVSLAAFLCVVVLAQAELQILSDRNYVPEDWTIGSRAIGSELMTVRIFLKQKNLDKLKELFYDVSNPFSSNYGNFMTIDSITALVAPSESDVNDVISWLVAGGVLETDIINFKDSLKINAPVRVIENVFKTEIFQYTHNNRPNKRALVQYGLSYVPEEVYSKIDVITGLDTFPAFKTRKTPSRPAVRKGSQAPEDVGYVIPDTIRRVYSIPKTVATNPKSSVALIEFEDDNSFNPQDLLYFQQQMAVLTTKVTNIVGPFNPSSPDAESTLDVQYATAIADNTTVWFWTTTGWMLDFAQAFYNTATIPLVASMSWGWTSNAQCQVINCNGLNDQTYVNRTDVEWQKIALRGVSLFAASGDQGAPGDGNVYCDNSASPLNDIYPGASPYVTSVGATMLVASALKAKNIQVGQSPPICQTYQCATTNAEGVATYPAALITTGGGFNYYAARPSWQDSAVTKYLTSGVTLPPSQYYNKNNRAFPDVAGLGHNYLIYIGGGWEIVDGTSCSSPVWAAIAALINDQRFNAGKAPLGFMAPLIYAIYAADPSVFKSIPTGNNACTESCCAQYGWQAAAAWDPVTGFGTPNYTKLIQYAGQY